MIKEFDNNGTFIIDQPIGSERQILVEELYNYLTFRHIPLNKIIKAINYMLFKINEINEANEMDDQETITKIRFPCTRFFLQLLTFKQDLTPMEQTKPEMKRHGTEKVHHKAHKNRIT